MPQISPITSAKMLESFSELRHKVTARLAPLIFLEAIAWYDSGLHEIMAFAKTSHPIFSIKSTNNTVTHIAAALSLTATYVIKLNTTVKANDIKKTEIPHISHEYLLRFLFFFLFPCFMVLLGGSSDASASLIFFSVNISFSSIIIKKNDIVVYIK